MKRFRLLTTVGLLLGLLCLPGCPTVTPKTADLAKLHQTYADEFLRLNVPSAEAATAAPAPTDGGAFAQSLRAIHDYRTRYPQDAQELAHLQVLEGMIYLQSGRFGLAAAVQEDVAAAGETLKSGTGRVVRDRLFAQNFDALLEGWKETRKENNRTWRTFERVADRLAAALESMPASERAAVGDDEGGLYLATSAAVFYVWAQREMSLSHDAGQLAEKKAAWYARAQRLIGQFLSDAEKRPSVSSDVEAGDAPIGHLRYVQWYHWLDRAQRP